MSRIQSKQSIEISFESAALCMKLDSHYLTVKLCWTGTLKVGAQGKWTVEFRKDPKTEIVL